jgi:hypothetical protein
MGIHVASCAVLRAEVILSRGDRLGTGQWLMAVRAKHCLMGTRQRELRLVLGQ